MSGKDVIMYGMWTVGISVCLFLLILWLTGCTPYAF